MTEDPEPYGKIINGPWVVSRKVEKKRKLLFLPYNGTALTRNCIWGVGFKGKEDQYLGNVSVNAKRVLDVGTASGHMCFWMEKMGADVFAYDLSPYDDWDIVPYFNNNLAEHVELRRRHLGLINNSFWFAHGILSSKSKVSYGRIYDLPKNLGQFDVVLVGSILLHLRDPFLALQKVSALVSDVLVVTDVMPGQRSFLSKLSNKLLFGKKHRQMEFLPNASTNKPLETWWNLSPELITEFLKVLGFTKINTSYHQQKGRKNKTKKMFTIIAKR